MTLLLHHDGPFRGPSREGRHRPSAGGPRRHGNPGGRRRASRSGRARVSGGAQAASSGDDVSLTPGTVAYLRALSERTEVLGVRGEFSAATLARIGVSNTLVMGCPSNFIAPNATLGSDLEPRYAAAVGRVTVAAGSTLRHLKSVERQLYRWMARSGGLWFPQSGPALELWPGWGGWSDTAYRKVRDYVTPLAQRPLRRGEFDDVVSRRLRVLLDVPAWMNELRTCDAAFGTRFHGNMLAFQAGVPTVVLSHDAAAVYRLCRRRVR